MAGPAEGSALGQKQKDPISFEPCNAGPRHVSSRGEKEKKGLESE